MDKIRLSFLGDIMFEKYSLHKNHEKTNFHNMLKGIKPLLNNSNIVIGNIETVFAGKDKNYTNEMYSFNTPDQAIKAIKNIGVDYAIINNNHILDRGIEGRNRTIDKLEESSIKVLAKDNDIDIININEMKVSILPYTSSTNYLDNGEVLDKDAEKLVRLLAPYDYYEEKNQKENFKHKIFKYIYKTIGYENAVKLLKKFGKSAISAYKDNLRNDIDISEYENRVKKDLINASKKSDINIVIPHMGGQFNTHPGDFSKFYMDIFTKNGADIVIGHHPHIIQKFDRINDIPCFYSIGNVSMSMKSPYIIKDNNPEIGIIVHIDIYSKDNFEIYISPYIIKEDNELIIKPLGVDDKVNNITIKDWLENRLEANLIYEQGEYKIIS